MTKPNLSIILSTYNRARLLNSALESLVNQTAKKNLYEVIVVDNHSIDNTKQEARLFIKKHPQFKVKYIFEKKQGLSYARNTGSEIAQGEYLAFLDDDARADPDWVAKILTAIEKIKPDLLGGPVYPYYLIKKPKWFKDQYGTITSGNRRRFLKAGEYLSGSNFIIKKDLLRELGGFDVSLGMSGERLGFGEETKLMIEARKKIKNVKIFYDPRIKVRHLVPKEKMRVWSFIKRSLTASFISRRVYIDQEFSFIKDFTILMVGLIKAFFNCLRYPFRDLKKYPYWQNYFLEVIWPDLAITDRIYSYFCQPKTPARWSRSQV